MPRSLRSPLLLLVALLMVPATLGGQEAQKEEANAKRSGLIPIPVLSYTPETKLAFGAAAQYYYRPASAAIDARPSTLTPLLVYTTEDQIVAALFADLWFRQETLNLAGYIGYSEFPDKFYGIGNDTSEDDEEDYTPRYLRLRGRIQKRLVADFRLGLGYEYEHSTFEEVEADGLLSSGGVRGGEGGKVAGATVLASWDTRDNIFAASSGSFHQLTATFYEEDLGSDYGFAKYMLDVRGYIPTRTDHVLALQGFVGIESGEPPFQHLFLFGGEEMMRGYFLGRFRDEAMILVQAEYRIVPVWWRFGAVLFAGVGDVAAELGDFVLSDMKYSLGGGIRVVLNRQERIALRLDFGFGEDTSGFYITLGEAF